MNIVILHCHFERGGVTQVVENHISAIADDPKIQRIGLCSSSRTNGLHETTLQQAEQVIIDDMEYDSLRPQNVTASVNELPSSSLTNQIHHRLTDQGFDPHDTILHWHNHSLGKNVAAPGAIRGLAQRGWPVLLQVHDFAEDYRPENIARLMAALPNQIDDSDVPHSAERLSEYLYPIGPAIRYATLTHSDASVLSELGVPRERLHCLPNSVSLGVQQLPPHESALELVRRANGLPSDSRWCLYPVRGIRRKNVGEWLLLSRLMPDDLYTGLTLRPTTTVESQSYDRWKSIAQSFAPRAVFDAGMHDAVGFLDNLAASEFIVSTSVAEGFGMVFLEPWLADKGVIARNLPSVTNDFRDQGLDLSSFYDSILIPIAASEQATVNAECKAAFELAMKDMPEDCRPDWKSTVVTEGHADFATLIPQRQIEILSRMNADPGFEQAIRDRSAELIRALHQPACQQRIRNNRSCVAENYSLDKCRERLLHLYEQVLSNSRVAENTGTAPQDLTGNLEVQTTAIESICSRRTFFPCRTETFS